MSPVRGSCVALDRRPLAHGVKRCGYGSKLWFRGSIRADDRGQLLRKRPTGERRTTPPYDALDPGQAPACRLMWARRIGFSTNQASSAAMAFITLATMNTVCQLPVAAASTLDSGTSSDAVPLAV